MDIEIHCHPTGKILLLSMNAGMLHASKAKPLLLGVRLAGKDPRGARIPAPVIGSMDLRVSSSLFVRVLGLGFRV